MVYKAEDTKLKRAVALKFLAAHLLQDEEARKRFQRDLCFFIGHGRCCLSGCSLSPD